MRASSPATPTPRTRLSACSSRPLKLFGRARPASPPNSAKSSNCRRRRTRSSSPTKSTIGGPATRTCFAAIETHHATLGCTPHLVAADALLLGQERGGRESQGRQARLHPQPLHQEPRAQTRTKEAL